MRELELNSKGLFSFLLVIAFAFTYFALIEGQQEFEEKLWETKTGLLAAEKASFLRALLEENTDFLIEKTIKDEVKKKNINPLLLKEKINLNLSSFYSEIEENYSGNPEIKFNYVSLNEKSNVLVVGMGKGVFLVDYGFHGGVLKDSMPSAQISFPEFESFFQIPVDYSKKVIVGQVLP
ncbi:MAG: hypothetical protein AB1467_00730 [Candidatus Diapherotrites archaeon]